MLMKELQESFVKKPQVKQTSEGTDSKKWLMRQYFSVADMLKENAKHGINQVRLVTSTLHPKLAEKFRSEGFIVWENSESVLIVFPLENITNE